MNTIAVPWISLVLLARASGPELKPAPEKFQATLDAASEVPAPTLSGNTPSGKATFTTEGKTVTYRVDVSGLSSAYTAAHIHSGPPGVPGPVIVSLKLTPGPAEARASGQGTIDAGAITGKKGDGSPMSMDDLLAAMRSGDTYVNVHTANNKPGETRGQIQPGG
jgi:hypothetical protein